MVNQAEYGIRIRVAASQEYVIAYSICRVTLSQIAKQRRRRAAAVLQCPTGQTDPPKRQVTAANNLAFTRYCLTSRLM